MSAVVMCACGDETLGVVTRCPRKALYRLRDPRRQTDVPTCAQHRDALVQAAPQIIVMEIE